jgi:hypothetical protein
MASELEIVSIHEAAHAVAYLHFGLKFSLVKIYPSPTTGNLLGSVGSPAGTYKGFERAVICMSGPVAEAKLTGVDVFNQPGSVTDLEMAAEALSRSNQPPRDLAKFVRQMVDHEWSVIGLIARHLAEARELSYEQVVSLMNS